MNHSLVVTWDDNLSRLIGTVTPLQTANSEGKEGEDEASEANEASNDDIDEGDDGSEAEPDMPAGNNSDIDFKYDPHDPAGLRLGQLSTDDAARYHLIKSACMKAGCLKEWRQALNSSVVELSSSLSTQTLTNARSKTAAKKDP